jgi:integrase
VPLEVVARQLGHADTRTVASTYGHLAERYREEMIRSRFSALVTDPFEGRSTR